MTRTRQAVTCASLTLLLLSCQRAPHRRNPPGTRPRPRGNCSGTASQGSTWRTSATSRTRAAGSSPGPKARSSARREYLAAAREHAADADVLVLQHTWPVWGRDRIAEFITQQQDMYRS